MFALHYAGKIFGCYAVTIAGVAAYAVYTVRKGRALARRLPDEDRPWT